MEQIETNSKIDLNFTMTYERSKHCSQKIEIVKLNKMKKQDPIICCHFRTDTDSPE